MNLVPHDKVSRRHGLTLSELVVTCAIAVAAMAGIAQLMYQATRQYRVVSRHNLVALEAANVMENLMSRPWSEIASSEPALIELSPACRQAVPDAELRLEIVPEDDQDDTRRITVQIHWATSGDERAKPIQLVAWRYKP